MVLEIFVRSYIFYSFESGTVYHFTIFIFITNTKKTLRLCTDPQKLDLKI